LPAKIQPASSGFEPRGGRGAGGRSHRKKGLNPENKKPPAGEPAVAGGTLEGVEAYK